MIVYPKKPMKRKIATREGGEAVVHNESWVAPDLAIGKRAGELFLRDMLGNGAFGRAVAGRQRSSMR